MGKRVVGPPQAVMFATLFWQSLHSVRPSPLSHGPNTRFTIISIGYLWHAPLFTCLLFLPCTSSCRVVILLHIEKNLTVVQVIEVQSCREGLAVVQSQSQSQGLS